MDNQIREALERTAAAVRVQLERDLSALADELRRAAAAERERAARAAAEIESLKRTIADERERARQQAAEYAAADMQRQAEMQARIAQIQEDALRHIDEIQQTAAQDRDRAVRQATEAAEADARRQAESQVAQIRDAAQKHAEEVRRAAEAQLAELRSALQAQLDEVRRAAHVETEDARRSAHAEVEDARRLAAAQVDDVQRQADERITDARRAAEAQIEEIRRRARAEVEQARADVETARAEAEDVVIAQLASAQADAAKNIQEAVDRTRTDAHQAELAYTARVVDAIRRLDEARSLGEVLDTLAECAARQVERAAVLVLNSGRLRVRRLAGFATSPASPDLDLESAGIAGAVVGTGVTVSRAAVSPGDGQASRQPALPSFAADGGTRHAVALPIVVGGRVVAVLYADAPVSDAAVAARWPATLEVLVRHASRGLEAVTVQRAAGLAVPRVVPRPSRSQVPGPLEHAGTGEEDAARRYARLLVSEIRMYHEPVVDAGRRSRDLRTRLGGEIDRARQLYEERVPPAIRERSDYFEQELVRTLADGDRSLLG
jgi:hypothetical protein